MFWAILAIIGCAVATAAQGHDFGYVEDGGGVVRSGTNLCWRTGFWSPALAIAECDPDLVKKAEAAAMAKPALMAAKEAPAKMAPKKIELTADSLFDTNKSVLKSEGMEKLDSLSQSLDGVNFKVIMVTGHADYRSSTRFNQKLSERRANAVKSYLESKGIANPIVASGKGESEPKTTPSECKGMKGKALSECLQPDRRVEVSVEGEQ